MTKRLLAVLFGLAAVAGVFSKKGGVVLKTYGRRGNVS